MPTTSCIAFGALEEAGHHVTIFPDAEQYIQRKLVQARVRRDCDRFARSPHTHPLRKQLLNAELLPYQLDGIAFAAGAGRAILADDMGLGKTIRAIGVAELLAQLADIRNVSDRVSSISQESVAKRNHEV